ncbi:hypothetical protein [Thermoleptolyngbya sp. C42_A2020_037]|uniref:hypothetical protein n=1 Tax=Thermoleptolyngbya sp. C42_A2020_037 TaxID=2747799 RepID=UPI0019E52C9A|nr:hypothetical protein [Thermoleptolyngbya sp. C42_A2020_037]MBF2084728.1 hypothetical protein [Thermoleptolyngbya sp. C42_A2020_037]
MTSERLLQLHPLESGDRPLSNDLATVLAVLQQGTATPVHRAFVASLQPTLP